jgi:protease I
MTDLSKLQIAVIATDGVEESEIVEPVAALRLAHADIAILSPGKKRIQAFRRLEKSKKIEADLALQKAEPGRFDALLLPGGGLNADALRTIPKVKSFLRSMQDAGKPIAAICHAPWELISAGLVQGRKLTSCQTIQDDVRNAGGDWLDEEVVVDGNWVTVRQPEDIPAFNREMLLLFSQTQAITLPDTR